MHLLRVAVDRNAGSVTVHQELRFVVHNQLFRHIAPLGGIWGGIVATVTMHIECILHTDAGIVSTHIGPSGRVRSVGVRGLEVSRRCHVAARLAMLAPCCADPPETRLSARKSPCFSANPLELGKKYAKSSWGSAILEPEKRVSKKHNRLNFFGRGLRRRLPADWMGAPQMTIHACCLHARKPTAGEAATYTQSFTTQLRGCSASSSGLVCVGMQISVTATARPSRLAPASPPSEPMVPIPQPATSRQADMSFQTEHAPPKESWRKGHKRYNPQEKGKRER